MKKTYEAPKAEVVKFEYKDQVVAASGCDITSGHSCPNSAHDCQDWSQTGQNN